MAEYLKLFRKAVDYEEYKETCIPPKLVTPTDYPVLGLPGYVITYEATSRYCPNNSYGDYDYILVFNGNASGRKFYVPTESLEVYKNASGWSTYANDILPMQ